MISDWIADGRRDLADVLDGLSTAQWDAPSLCDGWAVRHAVAHVTMPLRYSPAQFMLRLAAAGGRFRKMSDGVARRDGELPRAELIATLRDRAAYPWKPPGGGPQSTRYFGVDVSGVQLQATDLDWALGQGPPLRGPAASLILLLTGRRVPDGALTGPGELRSLPR